jgi:hypothetical protein
MKEIEPSPAVAAAVAISPTIISDLLPGFVHPPNFINCMMKLNNIVRAPIPEIPTMKFLYFDIRSLNVSALLLDKSSSPLETTISPELLTFSSPENKSEEKELN